MICDERFSSSAVIVCDREDYIKKAEKQLGDKEESMKKFLTTPPLF